jgi:hypothetical protein
MSRRYYRPAALRYLKARLWNLARPGFWITAIFLSVIGLSIKEYLKYTNSPTQKPTISRQPTNSSLSKEDKAIAADIDNLPVLYNDSRQTSLQLPTGRTLKQNTQASNSQDSSDSLEQSQNLASDAKSNAGKKYTSDNSSSTGLENPFVVKADNLLQSDIFQPQSRLPAVNSSTLSSSMPGLAPTSTGVGGGLVNSINSNYSQTIALPSPSSTTNPSINSNTNNNPNSVGVVGQLPLTNNLPIGQSLPTNNSPQILPPTGQVIRNPLNPSTVTGYTQPQVTNQPQNPYSTLNPYSTFNPYSYLQYSYIQYRTNRNAYLNRYNSINNSSQSLPSTVPYPSVVSPGTYTTPYYTQTPNQGVVSPSSPAITNSYNYPSLQQPTQGYQYNYPGMYSNGIRVNGYTQP